MKNQRRHCLGLMLAIVLFIIGALAKAQDRPQTKCSKNQPDLISDTTYLITVTVNLGHQSGALHLTKDNFVLSDNRIRQDIRFFTRIEPSNSGKNNIIYALGYSPPVWRFNGQRRKLRVVVYDVRGKKLKVHFSPRDYPGTKEFLDGP